MRVVPCMYKATINTKLEDLVKDYLTMFFRNLADVSCSDLLLARCNESPGESGLCRAYIPRWTFTVSFF